MDHQLSSSASDPNGERPMKDRLNGLTDYFPCRFLEWTGWYNFGIPQRLLGHYRLFQHYKIKYEKFPRDLSAAYTYVLHYQSSYVFKRFISQVMCLIYSFTKDYNQIAEYSGINRLLIYSHPDILIGFLTTSEHDFDAALARAVQQIRDPDFFRSSPSTTNANIAIQQNDQRTINHTTNQYHSEVTIQPVLREGASGKPKDVFSKLQVLILFDLLSQKGVVDKIDLGKRNRVEAVAAFFHALTGKSQSSFVEELNDHRNKDLYHYNTPGERDQLIRTLTHLATTSRKAGFIAISRLADNKIRELETQPPRT